MNVVLVSCSRKKSLKTSRAEELYISPLFKLSMEYARSLRPDKIFILSAKHGLLRLDDRIDPYDLTINDMPKEERKGWAEDIAQKLETLADLRQDKITLLAGKMYIEFLIPYIENYNLPLANLSIGNRLRYLKQKLKD